jgi:hypothetical protein
MSQNLVTGAMPLAKTEAGTSVKKNELFEDGAGREEAKGAEKGRKEEVAAAAVHRKPSPTATASSY